jgi:hypothetical protein
VAGPRTLVDGPRHTPSSAPSFFSGNHATAGAAGSSRSPVVGVGLVERVPAGTGQAARGDAVPFGRQVDRSRDDRKVPRVAAAPMRTGGSASACPRVMAGVVEYEAGFAGRRLTDGAAPYLPVGLLLPAIMAPSAVALAVEVAAPGPAGIRAAAAVDQVIERDGVDASRLAASDPRVTVPSPSAVVHRTPAPGERRLPAISLFAGHAQYLTAKGGQ